MLSKHLFVTQKLRLIGSTNFGFAQNILHDIQNTVLNSQSGIVFYKCHRKREQISLKLEFIYGLNHSKYGCIRTID